MQGVLLVKILSLKSKHTKPEALTPSPPKSIHETRIEWHVIFYGENVDSDLPGTSRVIGKSQEH